MRSNRSRRRKLGRKCSDVGGAFGSPLVGIDPHPRGSASSSSLLSSTRSRKMEVQSIGTDVLAFFLVFF